MKRSAASVLAMCALACGPDGTPRGETCLDVTAEYRAELDRAIDCDPLVTSVCVVHGAVVPAEQSPSGDLSPQARCTDCPALVNPEQTKALDEVLSRYAAQGCDTVTCPAFACPGARSDPA